MGIKSSMGRVLSVDPLVSLWSFAVTLHTDLGDLKVELFCMQAPLASENFLALCASDYYKGCIFHRNIKGFIVQTGDPTGTGKNGQSIWKKRFKDEFHDSLKHNARGIMSMANNGPDSNGSQFFITYSKQTMLDMKYSIFGNYCLGLRIYLMRSFGYRSLI
ncbi:unnamed protein product [Schistosoma rodhaini]|uniref:Peptidyl-prolyl cis-trans isomerase n=1 Tax=Schistosoma rodhaini TaxID=6188 RepID=A0AA85G0Q2_9TREM|nr:unnamed protein product [Schistosoma rodhaini]